MSNATDYLLQPDFFDEVVEGIADAVTGYVVDVIEAMIAPDGRVWPQMPALSRSERILSVLSDAQSGLLDTMMSMGFEKDVNQRVDAMRRDAEALGIRTPALPVAAGGRASSG